ncbi:unnamed protein product [Boreogadus saida]
MKHSPGFSLEAFVEEVQGASQSPQDCPLHILAPAAAPHPVAGLWGPGADGLHLPWLRALQRLPQKPARYEATPGATFYLTNNLLPALPPPPGPGPGLGRGTWLHSP